MCKHVGRNVRPEVIWVEGGQVQAATCLACAEQVDASDAELPLDAMDAICAECAGLSGIPTEAKMPDGFYEWRSGEWVRRADTGRAQ